MKYFNREVDRIMMPSTFRWDARFALDDREKTIMKYAPLVMKVVNTFPREEERVGILTKHDMIQTGFVGLVEGYDAIQASDGKLNVKYLELRVNTSIKRAITSTSTGVHIPESAIRKTKAEEAADKLFGYWLYSFRIDDVDLFEKTYSSYMQYVHRDDSYDNEELEEKLSDLMWCLSDKERHIVRYNFGIGLEEKHSMKKIAKDLIMSEIGVKRAKLRAMSKLKLYANRLNFEKFL